MTCEYENLCQAYIIKEQHKVNERRKQLLEQKKGILKYILIKKEVVTKPECSPTCWVRLDISRDIKEKRLNGNTR